MWVRVPRAAVPLSLPRLPRQPYTASRAWSSVDAGAIPRPGEAAKRGNPPDPCLQDGIRRVSANPSADEGCQSIRRGGLVDRAGRNLAGAGTEKAYGRVPDRPAPP